MAVRPPAVAGVFYPADPATLAADVDGFLEGATEAARAAAPPPKAIIAPHAGYVYSGAIAGSACAPLRPRAAQVRRVVLMGPAHRLPVRGIAASSATAFRTPLGDVPVDRAAVDALVNEGHAVIDDRAHRDEHSLEVLLPFVQRVFPGAAIVPLAVGYATTAEVAAVLERLWGGDETAVIISSDLSHYLPQPEARTVDARTAGAIEALHDDLLDDDSACGVVPIRGLLRVARARQIGVRAVDLRNSGDTAGPPDRVVGYGAFLVV